MLEVNTLPGMTPASLVPREASVLGMEFGELLEILLKEAIALPEITLPEQSGDSSVKRLLEFRL